MSAGYLVAVRTSTKAKAKLFSFPSKKKRDGFIKDIKAQGWSCVFTPNKVPVP